MPDFRGRALIYPSLLIAGWIVGRSFSHSITDRVPRAEPEKPAAVAIASRNLVHSDAAGPVLMIPYPNHDSPIYLKPRSTVWLGQTQRPTRRSIADNAHARKGNTERLPLGFYPIGGTVLPPALLQTPIIESDRASPAAKVGRLQFYGYNFWRQGSAATALAPQAQYGGSQYGAIATWDPFGRAGTGPALLLRSAGTPDGLQQEFAIGTRWQPHKKWPLSVSIERRFRISEPDGFAAYVAGGVDRVPLAGKLALDAYGQVGYALGGKSSPFVDAYARVQHPLAKPLGIPVRVGAGTWVGGQKGAYRADIGPTVSARIDNRFADFTLQVDWRKRVVGNAAPVDGLALTVSTDF